MTVALLGPVFVYLTVVAGVSGLLIGSFLNVVIYRVPNGLSVVAPPSACPACGEHIRSLDNIPVLSWLMLRARCRQCKVGISARYPLIEAGTSVFFAAVTLAFIPRLFSSEGPVLPAALVLVALLYLAAVSVSLTAIDLDTHTLPNAIVLPSYVVSAGLLGSASVVGGNFDPLLRGAMGLVALLAFYAIMAFAFPGGMGLGDVKLAGVLGLFLAYFGWGEFAVGAIAAFLFGGLFGLSLVLTRRANRKTGIPFGPWMIVGAWIGLAFGNQIFTGYLHIFGLSVA
jgi:leader peptidase (prepilin peptidase)/N-methyltransferase